MALLFYAGHAVRTIFTTAFTLIIILILALFSYAAIAA